MRPVSLLFTLLLAPLAFSQTLPADQYDCLKWRMVGPFRGGRTVGIDCDWSHPVTWYIGVNNGGVWKTNDYGRTWNPIFDSQPTGSIGALAIAQSNPKVVYVGSGEGIQRPDLSVGNGMYKTTDGGQSWTHLGLDDAQQIGGIAVDPKDENRLFVAVLGHPYGPNTTRGLFRSLDGGKTYKEMLGLGPDTGAIAVQFDPKDSNTVYCDAYSARQAPWENGGWQGASSGLYKSVDGGSTWRRLSGGLPGAKDGLGRIGFTICRADSRRIYACVDSKTPALYRSNDAGETWQLLTTDERLSGRGSDFAEVRCDPTNPDTFYVANTSIYRSTDGGKSYVCIKGSPGGDDYHTIAINPNDPTLIGFASDQGAAISVNKGETWSSWYNQPTAQIYHVSTDNRVPYRLYGGQQESGSVGISSRGLDGQITFRDWHPVGAEEYAYVCVDPLNQNLVYGCKGTKFDMTTGSVENIRPNLPGLRYLRTMPMMFSPVEPDLLYMASNKLLQTRNGGKTWEAISPDLSRESWDVPASFAPVSPESKTMKRRGVIYAVAPSARTKGLIWCGTDDGLVWVTKDGGKNWANVTPPGVTSWSKVSQIDAGHFDDEVAYVSVNRIRCDDQKPYIYRTSDFGKTWALVVHGLADDPVNAVREDPRTPGLVYCATERMVWFSNDEGQNWNSLRLNMPATSIRDLVVKDDDLVIATHGRGFWIMDSIGALRAPKANLIVPPVHWEYEDNANTDTPLPPDEPAGENPPDGVSIDYRLDHPAKRVTFVVTDSKGKTVRTYDSDRPEPPVDPLKITVDLRWAKYPVRVPVVAGSHRLVWDFRTEGKFNGLSMQAVFHRTPGYRGAMVEPGTYVVTMTVDGVSTSSAVTLKAVPGGHPTAPRHNDDD